MAYGFGGSLSVGMVKVFHWPSGEVEHKVVRQFGFGDCMVVLR